MSKNITPPTATPFVKSSLETYMLCAARWEPFTHSEDGRDGELCMDGMRYSTTLNKFGVPQLNIRTVGVLGRVLSENGWVER